MLLKKTQVTSRLSLAPASCCAERSEASSRGFTGCDKRLEDLSLPNQGEIM